MNHYLTTPIYYASGAPHLGHAYTTLIADCVKRYRQLRGDEALLVTGTDEHGQKIERAAAAAGASTQAFVDGLSRTFEGAWRDLDIAVDRFERTTGEAHKAFAQAFWQRLAERGAIYLGEYSGRYCVECEQYFTDGDTCPVHRRPLEDFAAPSYFFRLSDYRAALIDHIERHPDFIVPATRRNEVLTFLRGNKLNDLSISRTATRWGVPVPGDDNHVMYVWIDALVTYLSALAPDLEAFESPASQAWWHNTTHFIGKDILTFHAVYWPALLLAAGIPLPRQLIVNGWLTTFGRKISKSDPETIIDPASLTTKVGRDGVRWYFLKSVQLGQDVDYSHEALVQAANTDLANNLGNLFSRFTALARKRLGSSWQAAGETPDSAVALRSVVRDKADGLAASFESGNPPGAARAFIEAASAVNAWFQQAAPWQIQDPNELATLLWSAYQVLADLTVLATPFVPETALKARLALGLTEPAAWRELDACRELARACQVVPIYARVEES